MECKSCNKLFSKYCQLQFGKGPQPLEEFESPQDPVEFGNVDQKIDQKLILAGRDGRQASNIPRFRGA